MVARVAKNVVPNSRGMSVLVIGLIGEQAHARVVEHRLGDQGPLRRWPGWTGPAG